MKRYRWGVAVALLALAPSGCDNGDQSELTVDGGAPTPAEIGLDAETPRITLQPVLESPEPPAEPNQTPEITEPPAPAAPAAIEEAASPAPLAQSPPDPQLATNRPLLDATEAEATLTLVAEADADAGWRYAQRCVGCHSLAIDGPGPGASQLGPPLAGVVGRVIAAADGFAYSPVLAELGADAG